MRLFSFPCGVEEPFHFIPVGFARVGGIGFISLLRFKNVLRPSLREGAWELQHQRPQHRGTFRLSNIRNHGFIPAFKHVDMGHHNQNKMFFPYSSLHFLSLFRRMFTHLFLFISSIMYYGVLSSCMVRWLVFFHLQNGVFWWVSRFLQCSSYFLFSPGRRISSFSYLFFLLTWHVWSDGLVLLFFSNDHDNSCACICMRPAYGIRHKAETSISVSSFSSLSFPMWWVESRLCWCGEFFAFFAFVFILDAMVIYHIISILMFDWHSFFLHSLTPP